MLRRLAALTAASTLTALTGLGAAAAADLAAAPYQRTSGYVDMSHNLGPWQGFYVGAVGGFGTGTQAFKSLNVAGTSVGLPAGFPATADFNGATFGGTVGFNNQVGSVVFGAEGDLNWSNFHGSGDFNGSSVDAKMDSYGTARLRLGWAFGSVLPYLTGGVLWSHSQLTLPVGGSSFKSVTNEYGPTWGGGVEVKLDRNWSVKGEYLYAKTGLKFDFPQLAPGGADIETKGHENLFRAGVNYTF